MTNEMSPNGYDQTAKALGLDNGNDNRYGDSDYWAHLDGDELGQAIIDRVKRFHQVLNQNDVLRGWRIKLRYYYNTYRSDSALKNMTMMEAWGANEEFQYVSINHLRALMKSILSSVIQNPGTYQTVAVNSDADAIEAAGIFQPILDYYKRALSTDKKINKATEIGMVVDQGFMLIEWDAFASDGEQPTGSGGIWSGAPSMKSLMPWDVTYDLTKDSWADQDYVIVRDWVDREKVKAQFPQFKDKIAASRYKSEVLVDGMENEGGPRYQFTDFNELSNDIQVFKLFYRNTPWMPEGRFCMCLEDGTLLYESPVGLVYPKLPVERFTPDDQIDILLGYSPINELLGPQENLNSLLSAITTNANNYANQYIAVEAGTDFSARTLSDGQKLIEYPHGAEPPKGINLTAIPNVLIDHLQNLMKYMQELPGVSNPSRGQSAGANSTGSALLFLASQTTQNQGAMTENFAEFSAACMTSLLHVLRVFARTPKTIAIAGKNTQAQQIILSDALGNFDKVIVAASNPIINTPQGKMGLAQQLIQYGGITPNQMIEVATTGNLQAATDPALEQQFELNSENEWLMANQQILAIALDNHEAHIAAHKTLLATNWLRNPAIAQQMGKTDAPAIMQNIMSHIQEHMQFLSQNQTNTVQTTAAQPPGAAQTQRSPAMGHQPHAGGAGVPSPSPDAGVNNPSQGTSVALGVKMPNQPAQPNQPK